MAVCYSANKRKRTEVSLDKLATTPPNRPENFSSPKRTRIRRWLGALLGVFLLAFLLAMAIVQWVIFPKVPSYVAELERFLLEQYRIELSAKSVKTHWTGLRPSLTVEAIRVARPNTQAAFTIPSLQASLSWRSLWHFNPIFHHLSILEPDLQVTRVAKRRFIVSGFNVDLDRLLSQPERSDNPQALAWLSEQKHLEVMNGRFVYWDKTNPDNKPLRITDADVRWHANVSNWTLFVHTDLLGERIQTPLDMHGVFNKKWFADPNDLKNWSGDVTASFEELDFGFYAKRLGLDDYLASAKGQVDFESSFHALALSSARAHVKFNDVRLSLQPGTKPLDLESFQGTFTHAMDGQRIHLRSSNTKIKPRGMPERVLGNGEVSLLWQEHQAQDGRLAIQYLDLPTLHAIAERIPLPDSISAIIHHAAPQGSVQDIRFDWKGNLFSPQSFAGQVGFNHIYIKDSALKLANGFVLPGVKNLSGQVRFNQYGGNWELTGKNAAVSFPGIFVRKDLPLDDILVTGSWKTQPTIDVQFDSIKLSNPFTSLALSGAWSEEGGPAGTLDLHGDIHYLKASDAHRVIPIVAGGLGTNRWLEGAFYHGLLTQGKVQLHGALHRFPFHESDNGEMFRIQAKLENVTLDYVPSHEKNAQGRFKRGPWPLVENVFGDIVFDGMSMNASLHQGHTLGAQLSAATVSIPHYAHPGCPLIVDTHVDSDLSNMGEFVNQSPVSKMLGDFLHEAKLNKPAQLDLHLMVPITQASNTQVDGYLTLAGNDVAIRNVPPLTNTNATLHFTHKGLDAPAISAEIFGTPATANIRTLEDGLIRIESHLQATPQLAAQVINVPVVTELLQFAQGSTTAKVLVDIAKGVHIRVFSDLKGVSLHAPEPFEKKDHESAELAFNMSVCADHSAQCQSNFDLRIGQLLSMKLDYQKQGQHSVPTYGAIGILQPAQLPKEKGLVLLADLPKVRLSQWKPIIEAIERGVQKDQHIDYSSIVLNRMQFKTQGLRVEGLDFGPLQVNTHLVNSNRWDGSIQANSVKGDFSYLLRHHDGRPFVSANLEHLYLNLPQAWKERIGQGPSQPQEMLPGVDITVQDLHYEQYALGRVRLHALNEGRDKDFTWSIKELSAQVPEANLNVHGSWSAGLKEQALTRLSATLDVKDFGQLLARAQLPAVMRSGKGQIQANLDWSGAPNEFNLEHLNGTLASTLGSGQLLQIEPGAARILSLLSLQTLQRRLLLDFRDVVGTGFVFDSILSQAQIKNGVLRTDDFNLVGPQATVLLAGTVNLPKQHQDLTVTVLPSISFGGPALALSLANPIVGVGSFLAQLALQAPLSKLFSIQYHVSGTFDEPKIEKIQKKTPEVTSDEHEAD